MHEAQMQSQSCFITLTYDEEHVPENFSVDVSHFQKFCKRLRKSYGPFRYFHCGEYGEMNSRPHYHALIFGIDFRKDRVLYQSNPNPLYTSADLAELWGMGFCLIGDVTFQSAQYVAAYVIKKQNGERQKAFYEIVDPETGEVHERKPPYATMSRNKGLGETWIRKYMSDVYPEDVVVMNGEKSRPPRYYDSILEKVDPDLHQKIKAQRIAQGSKHEDNNTPDRLHTRETITNYKLKEKNKTL